MEQARDYICWLLLSFSGHTWGDVTTINKPEITVGVPATPVPIVDDVCDGSR